MKLLHSADWHLDSPLQGRTAQLRDALLRLPRQVVEAAQAQQCDLLLLSGDLFDGPASAESIRAVKDALGSAGMPVFIAPGNHDFVGAGAPWRTEVWPENVHIFTDPEIHSVALPQLNCRIYGAAFTDAYMASQLADFRAQQRERWAIGVFHGDPTQATSPYNPITAEQIRGSGLTYLALGHIHKCGQLRFGDTLCGWPGCPMGRGFDETEEKGVYLVTLEDTCTLEFLSLDTPRFYDWECPVTGTPEAALEAMLPALGNEHHYRITLTGECETPDLAALAAQFSRFPNLLLRNETVPPLDLWANAGEDTLEGTYFALLRQAMEGQDEATCRKITLAARISRQLLLGQEVKLP